MAFLIPRRDLQRHSELFEEFFNLGLDNKLVKSFKPSLDVKEDEQSVTVLAEIPGLDKKEISIDYHDGVLSISGEKKTEASSESNRYTYREIRSGSFSRQVHVGDIDFEKSSAEYKDGVLTVTLSKREERRPKSLEIK